MAAKAGRKKRITPRKEPLQARAVGTVEAILQAATYILLRKGWDGLTTNRIAERAGVNIASLYQYFPNKEAIVAELMRRHAEETRAAALRVLVEHRGGDLPAVVRTMVRATMAVHAVAPELHRIFAERGPQLAAGRIGTAVDADIRAERDRWLERATLRAPNPELSLWVAQTAAHAVVHSAFVERPEDATSEELADEITLLLTRYLERG